jgi:hypothetical protein
MTERKTKVASDQAVNAPRKPGHSAVIVTNCTSTSSEPLISNSVRINLSKAKAK